MNTKKCCRCQEEKIYEAFHKKTSSPDGRRDVCKECRKLDSRAYYVANREEIIRKNCEYSMGRYHNEPIYREEFLARSRANEKVYGPRRNEIRRQRRQRDPIYRITVALRARIGNLITGKSKAAPTLELLGCTLDQLKVHLESQFKPGMTWDNYGFKGWHMDHIKPCISFNLLDPDEQKACFHYTNLRPLWWHENLSKGGKILVDEQPQN